MVYRLLDNGVLMFILINQDYRRPGCLVTKHQIDITIVVI